MKKKIMIRSILVALATLLVTVALLGIGLPATAASETLDYTDELGELMEQASSFVVVYHKQLGGSHYAYTEAVSDHLNDGRQWGGDSGVEANWNPNSKITLVTLTREGDKVIKTENNLIKSTSGVLRDPCVSEDGTKMVFSWKKSASDDYHLYEYTFATKETVQLTFGSGVADIEPVYTANGNIVFNSTRDIQTVDCWHTDVSNLYTCNADGSNITRLGYDQVHTTYPTTTSDGRILYTRWDYNDRSQMYVQALFQMFQDGTLQTEVFGNNSSNPTTLLHTREIPGVSGKYVSVVTGHHISQAGKLVTVDTSVGRNTKDAIRYVWTDSATSALQNSHDNDNAHYQSGKVFKYPIAISEDTFLVSSCDSYSGTTTPFNIELIYGRNKNQVIVEGSETYPASQVALVKNNPMFNRASLVNYNSDYGTYYVGNVYEGESMKGVAVGSVKYLRVVALEFRSSAIGATVGRGTGGSDPFSPIATGNGSWDVKKVLGIVDVYPDGSAMFTAPSETPLYFQLLDENGDMIQTMRSWSTLQPGEYFSCVGCHLDKNYAPSTQSGITQAMKAGVQEIRPDLWMEAVESYEDQNAYDSSTVKGFDYLEVVQPILDANCITCHSDSKASYDKINASAMNNVDLSAADTVIGQRDDWSYTTTAPSGAWTSASYDSSAWDVSYAPFGKIGTDPGMINTIWKSSGSIWLRKTVTLTQYDLEKCAMVMNVAYNNKIEIYINGTKIYTGNTAVADYTTIELNDTARNACKVGQNTIAVKVTAGDEGQFFDLELLAGTSLGSTTNLVEGKTSWKVKVSSTEEITGTDWTKVGYSTTGWKNATTPLGNRAGGNGASGWGQDGNDYLWAIKTFTVDDLNALKDATLYLNTFYDDDVKFYLNGNLIHSDGNWLDNYQTITVGSASKYLVKGTNVLAVSVHQHAGGYELDASLYAETSVSGSGTSDAKFSLEGTPVIGQRMRKYFPLSYLVLTGSKTDSNKQWLSESSQYINYISSMSKSEILQPNKYGSSKSKLITKLRAGHGNLSDAEIRAIACWIDLCIPCYGSYYVRDAWDGNDVREYEEELHKRELYDKLDEYAKLARAGATTGTGEIKIEYTTAKKDVYTATGEGMVILYTSDKYSANDKLVITLPEGEKYVALCLNSRVGEAIIYCPDGKFTYTFPNTGVIFPNTMDPTSGVNYKNNTITARLVTAEELAKEHNLALNPYDLTDAKGAYPHASTSNVNDNNLYWAARCAIDGFTANKGHGEYPYQSWGPSSNVKATDHLTIDFGREVTVNELVVVIRADFPHDSYFTGCTVTFSDGTTKQINLTNSALEQVIDLGGVTTSSIKLSGFTVETAGATTPYAALTEVKVMGTEVKQ
ncbi:MAG: hypothetical protein ACI3YH_03560 [Eubacteriales bacterium]